MAGNNSSEQGCRRAKQGKKGLPMRVLLIEDEPTTARAIELMLTTEGFNVYSTDLGREPINATVSEPS